MSMRWLCQWWCWLRTRHADFTIISVRPRDNNARCNRCGQERWL